MIDRTYIRVIFNIPEAILKLIFSNPVNNRVVRFFNFPCHVDYAYLCLITLQQLSLENITNLYMPVTACMLDSDSNVSLFPL